MKVYILLAAYATLARGGSTDTDLKLIATQPEDLLPPSQQKPSQEERSSHIAYSQEVSPCSAFGYGFKYEHGVGSSPFNYFYYSPPSDLGLYGHERSSDDNEDEKGKPQVRASEKKDKPRSSFNFGLASDIPSSPVISTSISNIKNLGKSSAKLSGISDYSSPISYNPEPVIPVATYHEPAVSKVTAYHSPHVLPVLGPYHAVAPTLNVNPYPAESAIPVIPSYNPTPTISDVNLQHEPYSTHVAPYHSPYAYSEVTHHTEPTPVLVPHTYDAPFPEVTSHLSAGIHPAYTTESAFGNYGYSHDFVLGQSVGVFPYSNVGGCGVPLLGSCSPQVTFGYLTPIDYGYGKDEHIYNVHTGHGYHPYNNLHVLYREDDSAKDNPNNGTTSSESDE